MRGSRMFLTLVAAVVLLGASGAGGALGGSAAEIEAGMNQIETRTADIRRWGEKEFLGIMPELLSGVNGIRGIYTNDFTTSSQ